MNPKLVQSLRIACWSILCFGIVLAMYVANWPLVTMSGIQGDSSFGDLRHNFQSGACWASHGLIVYHVDAADLFPGCKWHAYGFVSLIAFGALSSHVSVITVALFATFLFLIAWIVLVLSLDRVAQKKKHLLIPLLILTPALQLMFERSNVDLWIATLLAASAFFALNRFYLLSLLLVLASTLLKFYLLPLALVFGAWVFFSDKRRKIRVTVISALAVALLVLTVDLILIQKVPDLEFNSFGLRAFDSYLNWLGLQTPWWASPILSLAVVGVLALTLFGNVTGFRIGLQVAELPAFFFASTLLICYLLARNGDYRLVFLAVLMTVLNQKHFGSRLAAFSWFFAAWMSLVGSASFGLGLEENILPATFRWVFAIGQLVGDVAMLVVVAGLVSMFKPILQGLLVQLKPYLIQLLRKVSQENN